MFILKTYSLNFKYKFNVETSSNTLSLQDSFVDTIFIYIYFSSYNLIIRNINIYLYIYIIFKTINDKLKIIK